MKTMRWVCGALALAVLGAWCLDFGRGAMQAAGGARQAISVSYETTRLTEPRHPDGGVDYLAALNQEASQGVTAENNAVVELVHAFGPVKIPSELQSAFFQMLGMEPLPDEGVYWVSFDDYCQQTLAADVLERDSNGDGLADLDENLWRAEETPWTADAFPEVAAWLNANDAVLKRIVAASQRTRYYCPLVCKSARPALMSLETPTVYMERAAARTLATRAMLHLGSGNVEAAWHDALACHRLSRLVGQGPLLLAVMWAYAIDDRAHSIDRAILPRTDLSARQLRQMLDDLSQLAPTPSLVERLDRSERFMYLDVIQYTAAEGPTFLGKIADFGNSEAEADTRSLDEFSAMVIDYNAVMRSQNEWLDRAVLALREPTWVARRTAIRTIQAELDALSKQPRGVVSVALSFLSSPRKSVSDGVGQILFSLSLESFESVAEVEVRAEVARHLVRIGFRLAQYRAEHGEYPTRLEELAPHDVAAMPSDPYADRPFVYRRQPQGYVLYSVGPNGKDDGGVRYRDPGAESDNDASVDDIALRVPHHRPQREPQ